MFVIYDHSGAAQRSSAYSYTHKKSVRWCTIISEWIKMKYLWMIFVLLNFYDTAIQPWLLVCYFSDYVTIHMLALVGHNAMLLDLVECAVLAAIAFLQHSCVQCRHKMVVCKKKKGRYIGQCVNFIVAKHCCGHGSTIIESVITTNCIVVNNK